MNLPLAPLIAAVLGVLAMFGVGAMPTDILESLVMDSGLPALLASAEPPLGMTARALVALGSGMLVAGLAWVALFILIGSRGIALGDSPRPATAGVATGGMRAPVLRRADAHPDAPPRPPLRATLDLGMPAFAMEQAPYEGEVEEVAVRELPTPAMPAAPMMPEKTVGFGAPQRADEGEVEKVESLNAEAEDAADPFERDLPVDLEQPLAAFDPGAIRATPLASPVPPRVPAKPPVFEENERFETFALTPPPRPAARPVPMPAPRRAPTPEPVAQLREPVAAPVQPAAAEPIAQLQTEASVHALLDRLERGMARKAAPPPEPPRVSGGRGLEETLATLRNLARQA